MKDCVLIGSKAIEHWLPFYRATNDTDWLTISDGYITSRTEEFHKATSRGLKALYDRNKKTGVVSLTDLYTLKLSHSFWDINWSKTMSDISFFQSEGVDYDPHLLELLYGDWLRIHGTKRVNLNKGNDDFFNKHVKRRYVHDDVHRAVSYHDEPLFTRIQIRPDTAMVSKRLFEELSFDDKLNICREEAYVIALERYLLPNHLRGSYKASYNKAMRVLVTQLSKGWFPEFIVTNWNQLNTTDINYLEKFKNNIGNLT
jgi:hypothetical protein